MITPSGTKITSKMVKTNFLVRDMKTGCFFLITGHGGDAISDSVVIHLSCGPKSESNPQPRKATFRYWCLIPKIAPDRFFPSAGVDGNNEVPGAQRSY